MIYFIFEDEGSCMDIIHHISLQFNSKIDSIAKFIPTCGFSTCNRVIKQLLKHGYSEISYVNKGWEPISVQLRDNDILVVYLDGVTAFVDTYADKEFVLSHNIKIYVVDFMFFEEVFYTYTRFEKELFGHRDEVELYLEFKELISSLDNLYKYEDFKERHKDKVSSKKSMEKGANAIYSRYSQCMTCIHVNKDNYIPLEQSPTKKCAFFKNICYRECISDYCKSTHINTKEDLYREKTHGCMLTPNANFNALLDLYQNSVLCKPLRDVINDTQVTTLEDICKAAVINVASSPYSSVFAECGVTDPAEQERLLAKIRETVPSCVQGEALEQKMPKYIHSYLGK